jgi:hypothetical protein
MKTAWHKSSKLPYDSHAKHLTNRWNRPRAAVLLYEFNPPIRNDARPHPRQLILFSLNSLFGTMALNIPSPYKNYPKGYGILATFLKSKNNTKQMGFAVYAAEVSRFVNRFRLASAFIGIELDNYTSSTTSGYNAIFRVFLVWSAFERFLRAVGQKQKTAVSLLTPYAPADSIEFIRRHDDRELFFDFVYAHVDKGHRYHLRAYKNRTLINITYWASAVRHLFVHGHLSAHPGGCEPAIVKLICDRISEFHLRVMEEEFYKIVSAYKRNLTNRKVV